MQIVSVAVLMLAIATRTVDNRRTLYGDGEQDWGFVDVRKHAHMFYWLYFTTANVSHYTERPLVVWLAGGPGQASTGIGNMLNVGPIQLNGEQRKENWVQHLNVLYIDNPVGSGFSFVDDNAAYVQNNAQIASDLVQFMKGFFDLHPQFETVPLHIIGFSYAGKMIPEFALALHNAARRGHIRSNLQSIALGNGLTSPIDTITSQAPFLLQTGLIDNAEFRDISKQLKKLACLINKNDTEEAINMYFNIYYTVRSSISEYNILKPVNTTLPTGVDYEETNILNDLTKTMNSIVKTNLSLMHANWTWQSEIVYRELAGDFLSSAVSFVSRLLNDTHIRVSIFSGILDFSCATPGTVNWIDKMVWHNKLAYKAAPRKALVINDLVEGFEKGTDNFKMYWVQRAGHEVPKDNPKAMSKILRDLTGFG